MKVENKKEWRIPVGDSVIPAKVRYSKDISQSAKLIYGDVRALSFKNGYCNASNEYFGFLYGVDDKTISSWVNELVKFGFVRSVILKKFERKLYPALLCGSLKKTTGESGIPDKPLSEKPDNIDILIDNTMIADAPKEFTESETFNSKEEIQHWVNSSKGWLQIIGLFAKFKNIHEKFQTKQQLALLIPKYRKVATELAEFSGTQLREAFQKCDEMKDRQGVKIDWTLFTVKSILLK